MLRFHWKFQSQGTSSGHVVDHSRSVRSILYSVTCTNLAARNMMARRVISQHVSLNGFQIPQRPTLFSLLSDK